MAPERGPNLVSAYAWALVLPGLRLLFNPVTVALAVILYADRIAAWIVGVE